MTVWLVIQTYRYEDEHGGVTVGVFDNEAAATARAANLTDGLKVDAPYEFSVSPWEVQSRSWRDGHPAPSEEAP